MSYLYTQNTNNKENNSPLKRIKDGEGVSHDFDSACFRCKRLINYPFIITITRLCNILRSSMKKRKPKIQVIPRMKVTNNKHLIIYSKTQKLIKLTTVITYATWHQISIGNSFFLDQMMSNYVAV